MNIKCICILWNHWHLDCCTNFFVIQTTIIALITSLCRFSDLSYILLLECSRVNYIFCCLDICLEQFFCIRPNFPFCVNNFATQLLQPDWLKNKHSHYLCLVNKHYLSCQLTFFMPMSFKRELSLSPREKSLDRKSKKQLTAEMAKVAGDVFSWEMMKNLRKEITKLTSRLEHIDRKTRTSNVVVTGLNCSNSQDAKADFSKLCSEVLDIRIYLTPL